MNVVMIYFYSKRFRFAPSFNNTDLYVSNSEYLLQDANLLDLNVGKLEWLALGPV